MVALVLSLSACGGDGLPDPESDVYAEAVAAFYTGLAAMQVGEGALAADELERAAERAPGEPAAWANLGLLALRRSDLDAADGRLAQARELAPENGRILYFSGLLERARARPGEAAAYFQQALRDGPEQRAGRLRAGAACGGAGGPRRGRDGCWTPSSPPAPTTSPRFSSGCAWPPKWATRGRCRGSLIVWPPRPRGGRRRSANR